jgi:homoserine dehydrogenase
MSPTLALAPSVVGAAKAAIPSRDASVAPARVALLGTGNVGTAVLQRLERLEHRLQLVHVANTRSASGDFDAASVVIDATASDAIAARHAQWLARGIHVVTACKLGQGTSLRRWHDIRDAAAIGGTRYGDSATVGAGLPLLRTIRALRAGGDRIHGMAGVLSGSLAWLFDAYDGTRPFSECVREAQAAGYTEPDPRDDLSGEDVRRKLLILARAAGFELEPHDVQVESLADATDDALQLRFESARGEGRLAYVARLQDGIATARLETLAPGDPLAAGTATDNRVAIHSDRYATRPLVIQGPGAGAAITAAALVDDALAVSTR